MSKSHYADVNVRRTVLLPESVRTRVTDFRVVTRNTFEI